METTIAACGAWAIKEELVTGVRNRYSVSFVVLTRDERKTHTLTIECRDLPEAFATLAVLIDMEAYID